MTHIISKPEIVYMDGDLTLFHNPKLNSTISALIKELDVEQASIPVIINHLLITRYDSSFRLMAEDIARQASKSLYDIISETHLLELEQMHMNEVTGFQLYPDTLPFLNELKALNIKTALASNVTEFYRLISRKVLQLDKILDYMYLSCELGYAKLDCTFYERILKFQNTQAAHAIMIGDNEKADVFAALDAGLEAFLIKRAIDGSQELDTFSQYLATQATSNNLTYTTVTNLEQIFNIIKDRR